MSAIGFVLGSEGPPQCWFFVEEDEQVRRQPWKCGVLDKAQVAQQEGLAENQRYDCAVHWVSDKAIKAFDDKVAGGEDGCRCADALKGEACEGFEYDDCADGDE